MSKEELRSYRLNSMEEPTDEMLEAIMLGVQEHARQSTIKAINGCYSNDCLCNSYLKRIFFPS